tara:strand:- start:1823 stop:2254 length:432 start_codon:yes stop_codon:yes gene_type:complete
MLMNTFTIWSCSEHLRIISENHLFKNYKHQFLWPEKFKAHQQWVEQKEAHTGIKRSYLSAKTSDNLQHLKNLGALVVYIDSAYKKLGFNQDSTITVSGVNSIRACAVAMTFVANQLASDDLPRQSSLTLLPITKANLSKSIIH